MPLKNIEDIQRFQEESEEEFKERLQRYYEREAQAQEDFVNFIYGEDDEDEEEED